MNARKPRRSQFESLEARRLLTAAASSVGPVAHPALFAGATWPGAPVRPPAAQTGIDLSHWNLTLPTGTIGHPSVVPTAGLLEGYTSPYFYRAADGSLVSWCPVTGVTTPGSVFPRSELRETNPNGTLDNWSAAAGTATLNATLAVNVVPSTGKVVVGQIHDTGGIIASRPLLMLEYECDAAKGTGSLVAEVRPTPLSLTATGFTVATGIALNAKFCYAVQLQASLALSVAINGVTKYSQPIDTSWETEGLYFKAGAYCLDTSPGPSSKGAQVSFYALSATHA
jgi:hypothetical protein